MNLPASLLAQIYDCANQLPSTVINSVVQVLRDAEGRFGSLHAKCAIADSEHIFISSANLTEYAFTLNMEIGILVHSQKLASQVLNRVNSLIEYGTLTLL
jgi:phosphatidylserine/phosphatidylglycerophosphate/cardiolipin synthase-like enzyme